MAYDESPGLKAAPLAGDHADHGQDGQRQAEFHSGTEAVDGRVAGDDGIAAVGLHQDPGEEAARRRCKSFMPYWEPALVIEVTLPVPMVYPIQKMPGPTMSIAKARGVWRRRGGLSGCGAVGLAGAGRVRKGSL